jgi:hypothetical protein
VPLVAVGGDAAEHRPRSPEYRWSPQMAMGPNPCVRVCVSVSRVPAGRMERESLPATRRVGVAAPLSVLRPAA